MQAFPTRRQRWTPATPSLHGAWCLQLPIASCYFIHLPGSWSWLLLSNYYFVISHCRSQNWSWFHGITSRLSDWSLGLCLIWFECFKLNKWTINSFNPFWQETFHRSFTMFGQGREQFIFSSSSIWSGNARQLGGFWRFEAGDGIRWVLPWFLLFQLAALSYAKAIIVHWLADQWVTLCRDWYLFKRNLPDWPNSCNALKKKMTEVIFLFLFHFHSSYLIRAEQKWHLIKLQSVFQHQVHRRVAFKTQTLQEQMYLPIPSSDVNLTFLL